MEGRHVCLVERLARLVVDLESEVEFTNVRLMYHRSQSFGYMVSRYYHSGVQCCGSGTASNRKVVPDQDPHPDPHQRYKLDPDPKQFADDKVLI